MKSTERHELRRNELLELLRNPGELARRHGLTILIVVITAAVALWLTFRASGAEERKRLRAWLPLDRAVELRSEEQLRSVAADSKAEPRVRAWANVRRGEFLYNKSQQPEYYADLAARTELLKTAVEAFQGALRIGADFREIIGNARIGLGLCYENLSQPGQALAQYDSIISDAEQRFASTIWLGLAEQRKAFLTSLPYKKIEFVEEPLPAKRANSDYVPPAPEPAEASPAD